MLQFYFMVRLQTVVYREDFNVEARLHMKQTF